MVLGLKGAPEPDGPSVAQLAWSYMNDALRTNIFVRFSCEAAACACIHLALLKSQTPMPERWWDYFNVRDDEVMEIRSGC